MTKEVCLDANIFIASLCPELHQKTCMILIQELLDQDIIMVEPALVIFEVSSNFAKKKNRREMTDQQANDALEQFLLLPFYMQWQEDIVRRANQLAMMLNQKTSYDCSYLAVAEKRKAPFITLDQDFLKKGKMSYSEIYSPEEFRKTLN